MLAARHDDDDDDDDISFIFYLRNSLTVNAFHIERPSLLASAMLAAIPCTITWHYSLSIPFLAV